MLRRAEATAAAAGRLTAVLTSAETCHIKTERTAKSWGEGSFGETRRFGRECPKTIGGGGAGMAGTGGSSFVHIDTRQRRKREDIRVTGGVPNGLIKRRKHRQSVANVDGGGQVDNERSAEERPSCCLGVSVW